MTDTIIDKQEERLFTREFCFLLFVNLFSGMAGQMTQPLIAKFAMHLGAELEFASTITSLMSFAGLLLCPFAGAVADRINRKILYIVSNVFYGLLLISHLFVKDPEAFSSFVLQREYLFPLRISSFMLFRPHIYQRRGMEKAWDI